MKHRTEPVPRDLVEELRRRAQEVMAQTPAPAQWRVNDAPRGLLMSLTGLEGAPRELAQLLPSRDSRALHRWIIECGMDLTPYATFKLQNAPRKSRHFLDCDRLLINAFPERRILIRLLRQFVNLLRPECLACKVSRYGLVGPYPLLFELSLHTGTPIAVVVDHARQDQQIAGRLDVSGLRTLIISDVITTGQTIIDVQETLMKAGAEVMGVLNIYDREEDGAVERLAQQDLSVISLTSLASCREYARKVVHSGRPPRIVGKAEQYLASTTRLELVEQRYGTSSNQSLAKFAIAPYLAPPLEVFNERLRFQRQVADHQTERIVTLAGHIAERGGKLLVLPELSIPQRAAPQLARLSKELDLIIVGGAEYDDARRNLAFVAINGQCVKQTKLVQSPYDLGSVQLGDTIHVFRDTRIGDFAVLVCADQLDWEVLSSLRGHVDTLIICARNRANKLSHALAVGDAYRLQYQVIYVNDRSFGKSFLARPTKSNREKDLDSGTEEEPVIHELDISLFRRPSPSLYRWVSRAGISSLQ